MRSLAALLLVLGGCAVSPQSLPGSHPANASAPIGRLAGAPATLRAGVVDYTDVPPLRDGAGSAPAEHEHHHHHD